MDGHIPQLLTRDEVQQLYRLSKSTLYRMMRSGEFPLPIRIGQRAVRWHAAELNAWLSGRPYSHGDGIHRASSKAV